MGHTNRARWRQGMQAVRKLLAITFAISASTILLVPGTAVADLQAWDQEAVSALASDLAEAIMLRPPVGRKRS